MKQVSKKLFGAGLVACGLAAAAVWQVVVPATAASSSPESYALEATVAPTCNLTNLTNVTLNNMTRAGNTFFVTAPTDTVDATLTTSLTKIIVKMDAMCNYAHNVSVQSTKGALTDDTPLSIVSGTFLQEITYTVGVFWGPTGFVTHIANGTPPGPPSTVAVTGANIGTLNLTVTINTPPDTTTPVVAGTYTDTVKLQIGAAL